MNGICTFPSPKPQSVCNFLGNVTESDTVLPTDSVLLFRTNPCYLVKVPMPVFSRYFSGPVPVPPPPSPVLGIGMQLLNFLPASPLALATDQIYLGKGGDPVSSAPNQSSAVYPWSPATPYHFKFKWDPALGKAIATVDTAPILLTKNLIDEEQTQQLTASTSLTFDTSVSIATSNFINVMATSDATVALNITDLLFTNSIGATSIINSSISPTVGTPFDQDYEVPVQLADGFSITGILEYQAFGVPSAVPDFQLLVKQIL